MAYRIARRSELEVVTCIAYTRSCQRVIRFWDNLEQIAAATSFPPSSTPPNTPTTCKQGSWGADIILREWFELVRERRWGRLHNIIQEELPLPSSTAMYFFWLFKEETCWQALAKPDWDCCKSRDSAGLEILQNRRWRQRWWWKSSTGALSLLLGERLCQENSIEGQREKPVVIPIYLEKLRAKWAQCRAQMHQAGDHLVLWQMHSFKIPGCFFFTCSKLKKDIHMQQSEKNANTGFKSL